MYESFHRGVVQRTIAAGLPALPQPAYCAYTSNSRVPAAVSLKGRANGSECMMAAEYRPSFCRRDSREATDLHGITKLSMLRSKITNRNVHGTGGLTPDGDPARIASEGCYVGDCPSNGQLLVHQAVVASDASIVTQILQSGIRADRLILQHDQCPPRSRRNPGGS
jgi:hypothetical protein